jgi:hypothetical protein
MVVNKMKHDKNFFMLFPPSFLIADCGFRLPSPKHLPAYKTLAGGASRRQGLRNFKSEIKYLVF